MSKMKISLDGVILSLLIIICAWFTNAALMASTQDWPEWMIVNVAHRGGIVSGYPENTISSLKHAISIGVDVIEIDLRGTKDGEIVILHDETLDRTTNGRGKVSDYTLKDLKLLDAGNGEQIPTYEEILKLVSGSRVKLLLDIKVSPTLDKQKVIRLTEEHKAVLDVILGVREIMDLKTFQRLNSNIRTLGFVSTPEDVKDFIASGVDIIRLWPEWIKKDINLIDRVHQLGKPVWTTTSDAPEEEVRELIHLGINGIISDYPETMEKLLRQKQ